MLINFLKCYSNFFNFFTLNIHEKQITIYSEGKNYWPYLKEILFGFLNKKNIKICYVSSDILDPGLSVANTNLKTFYIGNGKVRELFFSTLNTKIIIMTMPDLDNYQIKRSKYKVNYVYAQHSLNSLHMAYRESAFNNFDTIICSGDHHYKEMVEIEKFYQLAPKVKLKYHYYPIFNLREKAKINLRKNVKDKNNSILIAPTWGKNGLIESDKIINLTSKLLDLKYKVILRPHPETIKHNFHKIKKIQKRFETDQLTIEFDVVNDLSLLRSKILITDWSGIAFEFGIGLGKPIIFTNTLPKINNPNYAKIPLEPIEARFRKHIGIILNLSEIPDYINKMDNLNFNFHKHFENFYENDVDQLIKSLTETFTDYKPL